MTKSSSTVGETTPEVLQGLDLRLHNRQSEIQQRLEDKQPISNLPTVYQEIVWEYDMVIEKQNQLSTEDDFSLKGRQHFVYICKVLRRELESQMIEYERRVESGEMEII